MDKLNFANIVILANHNPDYLSKEWLAEKQIFTETPVQFLHTKGVSKIDSARYSIEVIPNRLKYDVGLVSEANLKELPERVIKYVDEFSGLSYVAIGINSLWEADMDTIKTFYNFNTIDSIFKDEIEHRVISTGTILYVYKNFRVQLAITIENNNRATLDFNYHSDSKNYNDIKSCVNQFMDSLKHAESVFIKFSPNLIQSE